MKIQDNLGAPLGPGGFLNKTGNLKTRKEKHATRLGKLGRNGRGKGEKWASKTKEKATGEKRTAADEVDKGLSPLTLRRGYTNSETHMMTENEAKNMPEQFTEDEMFNLEWYRQNVQSH